MNRNWRDGNIALIILKIITNSLTHFKILGRNRNISLRSLFNNPLSNNINIAIIYNLLSFWKFSLKTNSFFISCLYFLIQQSVVTIFIFMVLFSLKSLLLKVLTLNYMRISAQVYQTLIAWYRFNQALTKLIIVLCDIW